jgi:hypothetical protein
VGAAQGSFFQTARMMAHSPSVSSTFDLLIRFGSVI